MGIFSTFGKVLGAAAPIAGGIIGGPAGAAIGSAVGGIISGGRGQQRQGRQVRDLQRRSASDFAARQPFQTQFGQGIQAAQGISAPDLTGRLGGTTQAQTGLIGQNLGLGAGTGQLAGQRLDQAQGLFDQAAQGIGQGQGLAGEAADVFRGAGQGLPEFGGIDAGTGEFSRGLNQQALGEIGSGQLPGFRDIGTGATSDRLNRAAESRIGGPGQLPDFEGIGAGTFDPSAQTQGLEGQAIGAVGEALGAPGIGAAAQGQLQNIFEQSADARKLGSRDIGRSAAAFGRVGSGVVNTQLGDLEERIQRGQQQAFRGLAGDTAQAEATDRLARAGLGLGAAGQFAGRDLSTAGFQQGLRGEARGERGAEFDQAAARAGLGLQQAGALQGLGAQEFGQEQALRGQDVGERRDEFGQALAGGQFGLDRSRALQGLGQTQFGQDQSLRGEARGERGAGLDEAFRREQLGQQAGRGLLGAGGLQGQLGGQLGGLGGQQAQLGALGQGLDLERLGSLRDERGFQAGQDQQQFQNRGDVFGAEQGVLARDRDFELDRLGQVADVGFGGPSGGIGFGDLGVLGNLTGTQNANIQQQQDLGAGLGDLFGGGEQQAAAPAAAGGPPGPTRFDRNIFQGAPVGGQFGGGIHRAVQPPGAGGSATEFMKQRAARKGGGSIPASTIFGGPGRFGGQFAVSRAQPR